MEQNLAVLIDFENIATGTEREGMGRFDLAAVFRRLKDKGRIVVARGYADWGRFAKFKQELLGLGVTMVELTSHGAQDKNRADIALVVDAMEMAFTRAYVDTFVILSGDSDFTPLVMRLRELNRRVIGCGTRDSTSNLLVSCCDEFIYYESVVKGGARESGQDRQRPQGSATNGRSRPSLETGFALMSEALEGVLQDATEPVHASVLKGAMLRKDPSFNEADFSFSGFGRFLEAAAQQGLVRLSRDSRAGGYRVESPGSSLSAETESVVASGDLREPFPTSARASELRRVLSNRGLDPAARTTRVAVAERVLKIVDDRTQRQKRLDFNVLRSDVLNVSNDTFGPRPTCVRMLMRALRLARTFQGIDENPISSDTVPFVLSPPNAEGLVRALDLFYLRTLLACGQDLSDHGALAELLFDDPSALGEVDALLDTLASEPTFTASVAELPMLPDLEIRAEFSTPEEEPSNE